MIQCIAGEAEVRIRQETMVKVTKVLMTCEEGPGFHSTRNTTIDDVLQYLKELANAPLELTEAEKRSGVDLSLKAERLNRSRAIAKKLLASIEICQLLGGLPDPL